MATKHSVMLAMMLDALKELFKVFRAVVEGRLIQDIDIGQAYDHVVLPTTYVNTYINWWGIIYDYRVSI